MSDTPINILIDGCSLIEDFSSISLKFSEGSFCNSIDINVISKNLWEDFDPIKNFGLLRLDVILGSMQYKFMCEERSAIVKNSGVDFSVWGRSAQALLDRPYSNTIIDLEEKIHPWQLRDVCVSEIINYVLNYCCSDYIRNNVRVHWNVEDFIVYRDSFSTSNNSPIEIISQLAGVIGAELVADADGSLIIQEYSVTPDQSIQEYNDQDDIISLSEDLVYPIGYNSVIVKGFNDLESESPYLSAQILEDNYTSWGFEVNRIVRCYRYHPKNLDVISYCVNGVSTFARNGIEVFTEWVFLTFGEGRTKYPNLMGNDVIKGDTSIPLAYQQITYQCNYTDFLVRSEVDVSDNPPYGSALFCFSDNSNPNTISFDIQDLVNANEIQMEVIPGNPEILSFKIWGTYLPYAERLFDSMYVIPKITCVETLATITENIVFTNGEGSLTHPYFGPIDPKTRLQPFTVLLYLKPCVWITPGGSELIFKKGSTKIHLSVFDENFPFSIATVSYKSNYVIGTTPIPPTFRADNFFVYMKLKDTVNVDGSITKGGFISVSKPVTEKKDIWIYIQDFIDNLRLAGVSIYIDGILKGLTGYDGGLFVRNLAIGEHTVRITNFGFMDSDVDDILNSTFIVE